MKVSTNNHKKSCVTINIHCGEEQFLMDTQRAIISFKFSNIINLGGA